MNFSTQQWIRPFLGLCLSFCLLGLFCSEAFSQRKTMPLGLADGFDFPCGDPAGSGTGYRLARGWASYHPGEDWNGVGGGNTDLGDPVYNIGYGVVIMARNLPGSWGRTVMVRHLYRSPATGRIEVIDSFYTHLRKITVKYGDVIERGKQVGTIGTNNGMYVAHLHFEIRHGKGLNIGKNRMKFPRDMRHYHKPTAFIKAHRKLRPELGKRGTVRIDQFRP